MRWENLFRDLEIQMDAECDAEVRDRERERERELLAQTFLAQRLRCLKYSSPTLSVTVRDISLMCELETVGKDWIGVDISAPSMLAGYAVISLEALSSLSVAPEHALASAQSLVEAERRTRDQNPARALRLTEKISFRIVLRDLCRRRKPVTIVTAWMTQSGTLDRVTSDYLEIACHSPAAPRRQSDILEMKLIPLSVVHWVRIDE